ncbi:hypothetical protein LNTAR_09886 [Lentisphaera araneosa HTCC2155]|uniref:Uncharacterized protein n=1 Tax=Lentisphaera araneosa HTCC2155 TaxID=313628 RepID=A6DSJ0_9BACT|nr:hypothetical protein LNTAR_09886 [Lentisphaera araneosa HTCC2155]
MIDFKKKRAEQELSLPRDDD